MEELYHENVYRIPESPVLVLLKPVHELSEEGRKTVLNLCAVLRTSPAPRMVVCTRQDLESGTLPGTRMIAFGHQVAGHTTESVCDFRGRSIILTGEPDELARDADRKKRLWSALQPWLQNP